MDKEEILNKLFALHRFGIIPGLERTLGLLDAIGTPHAKFPTIHVAGTNGKGSVCSRIASIFTEAGFKTGLYTSPHLVRFNERIRINGIEISDNDLVHVARRLLPYSDNIGCTFFEITTAMAFEYFSEQEVDIAIIETGMGGRYDSTNVLNPLLSIITKIDMDHQEYLGNTIPEIASEKAGIIKENGIVLIAPNDEVVNGIFRAKAESINSRIFFASDMANIENIVFNKDITMSADIRLPDGTLTKLKDSLAGPHQAGNLATSLSAIHLLKDRYPINENAIRSGLINTKKNTGLHGRIELIRKDPPLVMDVSHNPAGIGILFDTIAACGYEPGTWSIIFGVMSDKDSAKMLETIAANCSKLYAVVPNTERAMNLNELTAKAKEAGIKSVIAAGSIESAVKIALEENEPLIITGSFYVSGEAEEALRAIQ